MPGDENSTTAEPTPPFWRSRRGAAVAGIAFAILLVAAMTLMRLAASEDGFEALRSDSQRRTLLAWGLGLVPFAGIAFLWFIGVVRERLAEIEDRLFSTVFLGSGLLFLATLFMAAVTSASMLEMVSSVNADADLWAFGRTSTETLISVYAMRMAAVFTLSVSTVGLRTSSVPRWVYYLGYLVALVLLVASGERQWTPLLFPAWVLVLSVMLLFARPEARSR
ncbi:hypothetical protein [Agromyces sp. ZXT2-6]|uniref:hypothetical protein n=1 Tax=Agromyces sp. ZXT2-6 TaxID=3461153 RepID=UPI004054BC2A